MIKKVITIKNHKDFSLTGDTWGFVFGRTNEGDIEYYTGQTESEAYIATIPILLNSTIDDIGFFSPLAESWFINTHYNSGNTVFYGDNTYVCKISHISNVSFNLNFWEETPIQVTTGYTITYTGDTKINEFRRYGKTETDYDLYNPKWNSGYTQVIYTPTGIGKKITGEREKANGFDKQNLYDYSIWVSGKTGTTINYSDINTVESIISYQTSGLTNENSIEAPRVKLDYLIGVINEPKINIDVFIDRGNNSSFDRHIKLGDVKSLFDLENYGNGYFKIKEN